MSIQIEIPRESLEMARRFLGHIPGAVEEVAAEAINEAINKANVEATRQIQGQYTVLNKKTIMKNKRITRRASGKDLLAKIKAKGSPLPLGAFFTNPGQVPRKRLMRPLFAQVKASGGSEVTGAFITNVLSGKSGERHTGVFTRIGEFGRRGNPKLEKIRQLYGPSVPQMLGNKDVDKYVEEAAQKTLREHFERAVDRLIAREGAR